MSWQISSFGETDRVHLNRRGFQFSRLLAAEVCASAFIVGSTVGYTMFRGSVKSTGYPLHVPVSPSLPLPCVTVCHHISTGLCLILCHSCINPSKGNSLSSGSRDSVDTGKAWSTTVACWMSTTLKPWHVTYFIYCSENLTQKVTALCKSYRNEVSVTANSRCPWFESR